MSGSPDPKPLDGRKRDRDPFALRVAAASNPECVACHGPGANAHHVLERDDGGDDVPENTVVLCGSGTMGCHGAIHGNPYEINIDVPGGHTFRTERRDREWVARRIGAELLLRRPDAIAYLVGRVGETEALRYLQRRYYLNPADVRAYVAATDEAIPSNA